MHQSRTDRLCDPSSCDVAELVHRVDLVWVAISWASSSQGVRGVPSQSRQGASQSELPHPSADLHPSAWYAEMDACMAFLDRPTCSEQKGVVCLREALSKTCLAVDWGRRAGHTSDPALLLPGRSRQRLPIGLRRRSAGDFGHGWHTRDMRCTRGACSSSLADSWGLGPDLVQVPAGACRPEAGLSLSTCRPRPALARGACGSSGG